MCEKIFKSSVQIMLTMSRMLKYLHLFSCLHDNHLKKYTFPYQYYIFLKLRPYYIVLDQKLGDRLEGYVFKLVMKIMGIYCNDNFSFFLHLHYNHIAVCVTVESLVNIL
jgi:hypothetical protein